ncbi:MAG: hypothetical protein ACI9WC_003008 [Arenicella sp.]|jgi:hypothetical protein
MATIKTHITTQLSKDEVCRAVMDIEPNGAYEVTIRRLPQTRTSKQNRALHKWCSMVATDLNDGGYSVPIVLEKAVDGEWDGDAVKALLWKKVQKVVIGKESTTEADRCEYTAVYDVLNRFLGSKFGISVDWPIRKV